MRELTKGMVDKIIEVPLPHGNGPDECLHLMSMISPVDKDLAVVYSRLMVVPFRDLLIKKGIKFVEVPDEEYDTFACNVLALAPRKCVMIAGNSKTKAALEKAGATVFEYPGEDVSIKGGGGPTCLTRPLLRV
jgi:N-dimethylarginine dimethylaminohydrolase